MKALRLTPAVIMIIAFSTSAFANDVPHYPVDDYCTKISNYGGGSSEMYNTCINQEEKSYRSVQSIWDLVPSQTQRYCNHIASFGGGSYELLDTCIHTEMKASSNKKTFQY